MNIDNELGVIVVFAQRCESRNWCIKSIHSEFPDAIIENMDTARTYRIEFEYRAKSFISHGHDPRQCDLVICWENDWQDCPMTIWELSSDNWGNEPIRLDEKDLEIFCLRVENTRLRQHIKQMRSERSDAKSLKTYEDYHALMIGHNGDKPVSARDLIESYGIPKSTAYRWYSQYAGTQHESAN